jgi:hypothetical protein
MLCSVLCYVGVVCGMQHGVVWHFKVLLCRTVLCYYTLTIPRNKPPLRVCLYICASI